MAAKHISYDTYEDVQNALRMPLRDWSIVYSDFPVIWDDIVRSSKLPSYAKKTFQKLLNELAEVLVVNTNPASVSEIVQLSANRFVPHNEVLYDGELWTAPLGEVDWQDLYDIYGIPTLIDGVAYRGWIARVIARHIMGVPIPPGDIATCSDRDIYVEKGIDSGLVESIFAADPLWIRYVDDLNESAIHRSLCDCDLTLNQIIATKNRIFYSAAADEALHNHVGKLVPLWSDFFGARSYTIRDATVFSWKQLRRGIKFLVEDKIEALELPSHNVELGNLSVIGIEKHIMLLYRYLCNKYTNSNERMQFVARLESLLHGFEILLPWETMWEFVSRYTHMLDFWYVPENAYDVDARWKLGKRTARALERALWYDPTIDMLTHSYRMSTPGNTVVTWREAEELEKKDGTIILPPREPIYERLCAQESV